MVKILSLMALLLGYSLEQHWNLEEMLEQMRETGMTAAEALEKAMENMNPEEKVEYMMSIV